MDEIPFIDNPESFRQELKRVRHHRKLGKVSHKRKYNLTKEDRRIIHSKTDGKCHVCGRDVLVDKFEADHVKSHSSGGTSLTNNFLPACKTCNNYRWHYLSDEFQWILKLGVWARTEVERNSPIGRQIANMFISKEKVRENRRKKPRIKS